MSRQILKRPKDPLDFSKQGNTNDFAKQSILCNTLHVLKPSSTVEEQPSIVDFILRDQNDLWSMGENTYFEIKAQFRS